MTDVRYYITDHTDEMPPCDCTLKGWRNFLLDGNPAFDEPAPAGVKDGDTFLASVIEYDQIAVSQFPDGSYAKPSLPEGFKLHAIRYGKDMGWSPDGLIADDEDYARLMSEETDPVVFLAVMRQLPDARLILRADMPEMSIEAAA